jgi:hypothetical protein
MNSLFGGRGGMFTDWLLEMLTLLPLERIFVWFTPIAGMYLRFVMLRFEPLLDLLESLLLPVALDITRFF